jgi:hypothetical protein
MPAVTNCSEVQASDIRGSAEVQDMLSVCHVQHLGKSRGWIASCNIKKLLRKLHKEKTQGKGKGFAAVM